MVFEPKFLLFLKLLLLMIRIHQHNSKKPQEAQRVKSHSPCWQCPCVNTAFVALFSVREEKRMILWQQNLSPPVAHKLCGISWLLAVRSVAKFNIKAQGLLELQELLYS